MMIQQYNKAVGVNCIQILHTTLSLHVLKKFQVEIMKNTCTLVFDSFHLNV